MHTDLDSLSNLTAAEIDANRGLHEQLACRGVSDERLSELIDNGGLGSLLAAIDEAASQTGASADALQAVFVDLRACTGGGRS